MITPQLGCADVDGAQLAAVLGIGLSVVGYLLTLGQSFKTIALNGGKVNEYIAAPVVVGNKAEALALVKPFDSTVIHVGTS